MKPVHGSVTSYTLGFLFSLVLTFAAYQLIQQRVFPVTILIMSVAFLAIVQLIVQLIFFLHLNKESSPRWNQIVFVFMIIIVVIVVFGSLWIMQNLEYNGGHDAATPESIDAYILKDEGER